MLAPTFKSIHTSFLLEGLLPTVVWNALWVLSDTANGLDFEFLVLCCGGFILDFIRRVVDYTLWLALHECRCGL